MNEECIIWRQYHISQTGVVAENEQNEKLRVSNTELNLIGPGEADVDGSLEQKIENVMVFVSRNTMPVPWAHSNNSPNVRLGVINFMLNLVIFSHVRL
jgi:hypothetical protein